jgi:Coenzyme PQQ synthesis protein D (PqqD)
MKLAKYAKFRPEKFGGVLFETRSEKVYALNPTAAAIVGEIGGGCDESALVSRMSDRFSDSRGFIEREVLAFAASLRNHGLIEE